MNYVVCLPFVYQPYLDDCVATMAPEFKEHVLFIDNTKNNLGIMRSHNIGVDRMREVGADWLVVMSAAVRFGQSGGLDFIRVLEDHPDHLVLNAAGKWLADPAQRVMALGWHLTAFRKEVFDGVGNWDENFTPYGLDDVDLTVRINKHFKDYKAETFVCDLEHVSTAHSINLGGVESPYPPRNAYYTRKWGKDGAEWDVEGYATPFDSGKPLSYWPTPEDPLSIQNNEL